MKIYKNYGVMGRENIITYTVQGPHHLAFTYDEVEVEIPKEFKVFENYLGEKMIEIDNGITYFMKHIIGGNKSPQLRFYDGNKNRVINLKVVGE